MKRDPNWTEEEFEILLTNPHLHDMELARKLSRRSEYAVHLLRDEIHYRHTGIEKPKLSKMMRRRLALGPHPVKCPRCGENIWI
jgi:hypothetical protein